MIVPIIVIRCFSAVEQATIHGMKTSDHTLTNLNDIISQQDAQRENKSTKV